MTRSAIACVVRLSVFIGFAGTIIGVVLLALLSILGHHVSPPEPFLKEWTDWAVKVVGTVAAARALWAGSELIKERLRGLR